MHIREMIVYLYLFVSVLDVLVATDKEIATSTDILKTICKRTISGKQTKVLCQKETLKISCPVGTIVHFIDANFGRSSPVPCHEILGYEHKNCYTNSHTLNILRNRCDNTNRCNVKVSKDVFGSSDVCYTITKYLDVTYGCEHEICQDRNTTDVPNNITQPDNNTTSLGSSAKNSTFDQEVITNTNNSQVTVGKTHTENEQVAERNVLTITGIVLGVILAIVIFIVVVLLTKQKIQLCSKKSSSTNTLEMHVTSDNTGNEYDYSEVRTGPNISVLESRGVTNECSGGLENAFGNSKDGQIRPDGPCPPDDTYDVTNGPDTAIVDENACNIYDHTFTEQTEDHYDVGLTADTVVTQNAKDSMDDIYL